MPSFKILKLKKPIKLKHKFLFIQDIILQLKLKWLNFGGYKGKFDSAQF